MILISHRGNLNGKIEHNENHPDYIDEAIHAGYGVEIDIWYVDDTLYLGHDEPQYETNLKWLNDRRYKLWIHCKNKSAIEHLNKNCKFSLNYFWHDTDTMTLTSFGYIWAYPGNQPIHNSIAVLPEIHNDMTDTCIGVCSDFILKYI